MTEWHASDYYRRSGLQKAMADEELARLVLAGDERILDVGCGDGKITAEIADRVPRGAVVGIDPSTEMIAFASSHFGAPARPNLSFEVGSALQLHHRGEFDLVLSFNALHWVPRQDQALASIGQALRPGGRALLRMVCEGPRKSLEDVIEDIRSGPRWAGFFRDFRKPYLHLGPDAYRSLAESSGFRVLRLDVEDESWDFGSRDAFVAFARATFVEWTRRLPESEWLAFIGEVLDLYRTVAADGPAEASTFKFYQMEIELGSP
ncbi:MAG: methyltransferase domain-containing protein [Deltaproteobacteria bacterium]|nr:methyltransferase domain-containing protein [Deltaproteobacteria bacterium]